MRAQWLALRTGAMVLALSALLSGAATAPAISQEPQPEADAGGLGVRPDAVIRSGLPVPRFVSLRSDQVNIRTGPGVRYPVDWVFTRQGMPVEITAEFDTWRRIRDWEGTQGWVHQSMLSGRRTMVVLGDMRTLRDQPAVTATAIAQVEPGVIGRLEACEGDWCRLELDGYVGWMLRDEFWGVYPEEPVKD